MKIIETGAGSGTGADSILYFFKNFHYKQYLEMEYHIVEISPMMCKKINEKLSINHKKLVNNGQIKIINDDIINYK